MIITILNGECSPCESTFSGYMEKLHRELSEMSDNRVKTFSLKEMKLSKCRGCWDCWWTTPGLCSMKDGAEEIFFWAAQSDLIIMASHLTAGFTSSLLKTITDRLIVLLHPYLELRDGELHHKKRYKNYPDFGVILEKEADTTEEDRIILNKIYDRFALNFHNTKKFLYFNEEITPEEVASEISYL